MKNLVCAFDLIPGLVIDFLGKPGIIMSTDLDLEREVNTVIVNTDTGEYILPLSWADPDTISVIGVAQGCQPDNITLFDR